MERRFAFPKPTPLIIGVMVVLFAIWAIAATTAKLGTFSIGPWLILSKDPVVDQFEAWRLLTYALMHDTSGIFHLLMNGLMLWWFGTELEKRWGKSRFIFFMVGAALIGGVFFLVGSMLGIVWAKSVIGASAISEACIVAWALIFRDRTINLYFLIPIRAIHFVWIALGFAVLDAISTSNVSAAAHFGGIFFGAAVALGLWKGNRRRLFWDKLLTKLRLKKEPKLYVVPTLKKPGKYDIN